MLKNTNITDNPMLSNELVQYVINLQTILFIACVLVNVTKLQVF